MDANSQDSIDRRRERRLVVELPGSYQIGGGEARDIFFSQISTNGCRLVGEQLDARVGDVIELFLGPVGPSEATVRWTKDKMAGVEFQAPLDTAIVAYFAAFISNAA